MAIQTERPIAVSSPLGEDVLLFHGMTAREELGRLFQYDLDLLSKKETIKLEDVLGQGLTVRLGLMDDQDRFFHGIVSRFCHAGTLGDFAIYQATLRPWLWFLTRTANCRIFQEMKVPDIIKKVFRDHGFSDFEESLSESYRTWDYCVQYRETDFNFLSRLMEQEGIYYYFKHVDGKHTLVLSDSYSSHEKCAAYEQVPYFPPTENVSRAKDCVLEWCVAQEIQPGKYALTDFDFERPKADLAVKKVASRKHPKADLEIYDYPGEYIQTSDGDCYAKCRMEEHQASYEQVRGFGNTRGLLAGGLFELTGYPRDDQNREYLIVSASLDVKSNEYESGSRAKVPSYACQFTAMDSKQPYRPPRLSPKPIIQGPQTAIVVGKAGEEIWTDKYGRVKVQFHWDREGKSDENSSCWVRVASPWAGKTWGGIHIPRIGQEVIVEFLEGDPDRPIVTGRVYNADAMPPYDLPANQTQSGLKSRSTKGGGPDNFNEFRFEDKKGNEEIYLHAEKDYNQVTENDRTEDVGHDRSLHVVHDKSEKIDNNKTIEVAADHHEKISGNKTLKVVGNHTETIDSEMTINVMSTLTEMVAINYSETVGAAMELTVGGAMAMTVGAALSETVGGGKSETIGGSKSENISGTNSVDVGDDLNESVKGGRIVTIGKDLKEKIEGKHDEAVTKEFILNAKKVQIIAEDEITIKTGSAEVTMKKNGDISLKGNKIDIKGSGDVTIKGSKIAEN
jgi:type VI secretion system secreted protein VgrG